MSQTENTKQTIYTKQGLWSLFLMCAFPLHLWTLLLAFRDISWVTERTNAWDAVGVVSYGLLFALFESILVFLVLTVTGLILPWHWKANKRTGFLILLVMILSIWGMIGQLLFLWNINLPGAVIHFLADTEHPLRWLYAIALAIVIPTVAEPVCIFIRSNQALARIENITDQLSLLAALYLFFDLAGIIIVVIRNL